MSDERLMPAVFAVLETPEQPWTLESMAARAFLSRATFARHFARAYHLTPQGLAFTAADGNGCASAARGAADQP